MVKSSASLTVELWFEEQLRASHADKAGDGDDAFVWKRVLLVELAAGVSGSLFFFVVLSDITELLLNITHDFKLGG